MKRIILVFVCIFCSVLVSAQADRILGVYKVTPLKSNEESKVKIYKTASGTYEGQVIWLKSPYFKDGTRKTDINNPDPKKRNTPGDKILLMKGFTYDSKKDEWVGGTIYNPINGKTYKCYMKFESDTKLKVRGYVGVPALGESMYWYKVD